MGAAPKLDNSFIYKSSEFGKKSTAKKRERSYPVDGYEAIIKGRRSVKGSYVSFNTIMKDNPGIKKGKFGEDVNDLNHIYELIHTYIEVKEKWESIEFERRVQKGIEEKINNLSMDEILKMKGEEGMNTKHNLITLKAYQILYSLGFLLIGIFGMTMIFNILPFLPSLAGLLMAILLIVSVYRGEKIWLRYGFNSDNTTTNQ